MIGKFGNNQPGIFACLCLYLDSKQVYRDNPVSAISSGVGLPYHCDWVGNYYLWRMILRI